MTRRNKFPKRALVDEMEMGWGRGRDSDVL